MGHKTALGFFFCAEKNFCTQQDFISSQNLAVESIVFFSLWWTTHWECHKQLFNLCNWGLVQDRSGLIKKCFSVSLISWYDHKVLLYPASLWSEQCCQPSLLHKRRRVQRSQTFLSRSLLGRRGKGGIKKDQKTERRVLRRRGKQGPWYWFKMPVPSARLTGFWRKVCCFLKIKPCRKGCVASTRHWVSVIYLLVKHQHHQFIALPHEWPPLSPAPCSLLFHSFVMLQSCFWFKFPLLLKT